MIIISAMSENRVIGNGDGMPWDVPAEYQQYLGFVGGQTVIMGRKTYEIFGSDLSEGTTVIVVTRRPARGDVQVATSLQNALSLAGRFGQQVFVAGGASIYAQALPLAQEMYLSTIKGDFVGDVLFPRFDPADWVVVTERDEPEFVFRILRRANLVAQC